MAAFFSSVVVFLQSAIRLSAAFLFGATGETVTEKSGHLNLGIPGVMCVGAIGSRVGIYVYYNACGGNMKAFWCILMAILFALLFGAAAGLLYSFLTVTLRSNQNITGLAFTTFGIGFANFVKSSMDKLNQAMFSTAATYFNTLFTWSGKLGWFGNLIFSYGIMVYLAIIVAVGTAHILKYTKVGLRLRAVGESPATADAAGINVSRYRYLATIAGCAIAALGGMFYIMDYLSGNWEYDTDVIGWLAVALVIFTVWKPDIAVAGSMLFSAMYIAASFIDNVPLNVKELFEMTPYLVTILVLIFTSIFGGKLVQPPASLGINYFREER